MTFKIQSKIAWHMKKTKKKQKKQENVTQEKSLFLSREKSISWEQSWGDAQDTGIRGQQL